MNEPIDLAALRGLHLEMQRLCEAILNAEVQVPVDMSISGEPPEWMVFTGPEPGVWVTVKREENGDPRTQREVEAEYQYLTEEGE